MDNDSEECSICGSDLNEKFSITLKCHHSYHYECLLCSFTEIKKSAVKHHYVNRCPYCRRSCDLLPVVNGLTKMVPMIHYKINCEKPKYEEIRCKGILKTGKNKGNTCNKKCQLGYEYCKRHL